MLKQCEELSLPVEIIELKYNKNVEYSLLNYYMTNGFVGTYIEGKALFTVLKAYLLDELFNISWHREKKKTAETYLEAHLIAITKEELEIILKSIDTLTEEQFVSNISFILEQPFIKEDCKSLSLEFAIGIYSIIPKEIIKILFRKIHEDSYTYRNGWPDLIIFKDNELKFIEVKTKDKLHRSQIITIPTMREILPYSFSVVKVKRQKS